ncbi:WD40/YVTN/BNR-like repeat-containing protein [Cupriavidus oxalaticus]|uniref:Glycosyl hydrolase n=1 Tax=Cupriavidus oxalaticus TaxID=96344 RepID=A0A375FVP4_9BURK|nr:YCF48-related protein [Cupriavidus oxalaticus]QRQ85859.1 glycosyl hydrolase [Cupriavidus oxalaticus]QRQ95815.1 glycosyl hydrolase [Cupriavidus oxalaticus]WQD84489.1 YCF48-related protein [Cupriavidus oxalaticus]SPC06597.1 conserved exported hypothetical protein [Cupriavidus oxalaticus]SPC12423.1 conserved exported hypothetical protein [Cupriavidus oxalaticus]
MKQIFKTLISGLPLMVIGGLLYAGLFIKPKPSGVNLTPPLFQRDDRFFGITRGPANAVWLVGAHGRVLHSRDAAKTWQPQVSNVTVNLQDVAAWDALHAVAVGDEGVVAVTQDGGTSWRQVEAPRSRIANKLVRVKAMSNGQAWAVGEGGATLRTLDYGVSWTRAGAQEDVAWNDIAVLGQHAWRVGEFGRIEHSSNEGGNWQAQETPAKASLTAVAFRDARHGVTVGLGGTVLSTSDGGQHWRVETRATDEHLFDVIWDGHRWLATGDKGVVLLGDAAGQAWRATRAAPGDRTWHTKVAADETHYYFSGAQPLVTNKQAL